MKLYNLLTGLMVVLFALYIAQAVFEYNGIFVLRPTSRGAKLATQQQSTFSEEYK